MKDLPILFIIDVDNTLIGKSNNILDYRSFLNIIKTNCDRNKIDKTNKLCSLNKNNWKNIIPEYFFRPFIKEFFNGILELYPNAEFFIFSTGTKSYINIIIKLIENYIKPIKFNKPYFTREKSFISDTNFYVKNINVYKDIIVKSLKNKYPSINENIEEVLLKKTIIIDDLNVWDNDFRQIYIKPYNFQPIIEFDYYLLKLIYNNEFIYNYLHNSFMLNIEKGSSFNDFLLNYHLYMINEYKKNELVNNENINDNQFNKILIYLKKNKKNIFTKDFFTTLNKTLK